MMQNFEQKSMEFLAQIWKAQTEKMEEKKHFRPFVVEITGTPEAGKTSLIATLTKFFKRTGWRVLNPTEGAEITKKIPRSTHLYNIRTGIYALAELLDNIYSYDFDAVIFDRAIYDAYCWQGYWLAKGVIGEKLARNIRSFFIQPKIMENIDVCFFAVCSPEEAVRREKQWNLTGTEGATTNLKTIENLRNIWKDCHSFFEKNGEPVFLLDTTDMKPCEMGQFVLEKAMASIAKYIQKMKQAD